MEAEYEAVAVAILRVDSFQGPAVHRERLRVGSELHGSYTVPVAQHMATADASGTPIPFDVRVQDAAAAAITLRDALVQAADAELDTHLSACLHKWADRVGAPDIELVPEELRQHAISFDVKELATRPFVHHCPIPTTHPLPAPQLQQEVSDFDPQILSDVLFEWAIKKIRFKLKEIRKWHAKRLAGKEAHRPSALALDQTAFKPRARGRIWDLRGSKPILLDTVAPPFQSHLNVDALEHMLSACADREIVSMVRFGVHMHADVGEQIVIMPNLLSLYEGEGIDAATDALQDLIGRGWYAAHDFIPFAPWRAAPRGAVPRKDGGYRGASSTTVRHAHRWPPCRKV
jgi:hypothetical protein